MTKGASVPDRALAVPAEPSSTVSALTGFDPSRCRVCDGGGWVCENHADHPWGGIRSREDACSCGAGMPCGACNLEMACAGFTDREYRRAERLLKALSETTEMFGMAIGYMESVQHDMSSDPPWHHWADDGDGLEGFRAVYAAAIAMEARQGGNEVPSRSDDSAGPKDIAQ